MPCIAKIHGLGCVRIISSLAKTVPKKMGVLHRFHDYFTPVQLLSKSTLLVLIKSHSLMKLP